MENISCVKIKMFFYMWYFLFYMIHSQLILFSKSHLFVVHKCSQLDTYTNTLKPLELSLTIDCVLMLVVGD